jgi:hypothetical protein
MKVGMQFQHPVCLIVTPAACVRSNVNVRNSVPHPGKTGKIMDLYILAITILVEDEWFHIE